MNKHVIVGTAGHIDHGKSALVEALTGTHPDRLEEEKQRGITIDLGFAFLSLGDVTLGFVDVPGHERFVRNMLAGAGGIDLVLLVVAADESIKPQTREHFDICRLLGVERGIVAITKADLVEEDVLGLVKLEVEEFVRGSFLEGAPIVSVSARTGSGLDELKRELARVAQAASGKDASQYPRLPIDRAFVMKGFGTVVTGTLVAGTLGVEQEVDLLPGGRRLRVRGMHSGGHRVESAHAGQRTAVNLADISVEEIERGMALAPPGLFRATRRVDARISLLPSARPMKKRIRVHFHQGTAEAVADLQLLDHENLQPGGSAFAQLRIDKPLFLLPGDRFILRQFSPVVTMGGGVVLDALAPRHKQNDAETTHFLAMMESGSREEKLAAIIAREPAGIDLAELIARTGWLEQEIRVALQKLATDGRVHIAAEQPLVLISAARFNELLAGILGELEKFHHSNPLLPGVPKDDLRGKLKGKMRGDVFRAALEQLAAERKIAVSGDLVQRAGREIALSPEELHAKQQITREFESAGLAAPAVAEVLGKLPVDARRGQKLMQMLIREKTLVKVTEDLVFHRTALETLREKLAKYRSQRGERLAVPAFKELAGVSRKYAIPLLEYLDRERWTRRVGDERVIL